RRPDGTVHGYIPLHAQGSAPFKRRASRGAPGAGSADREPPQGRRQETAALRQGEVEAPARPLHRGRSRRAEAQGQVAAGPKTRRTRPSCAHRVTGSALASCDAPPRPTCEGGANPGAARGRLPSKISSSELRAVQGSSTERTE